MRGDEMRTVYFKHWLLGYVSTFTQLLTSRHSSGVLTKRCYENLQIIYRRTPMPKCDFNKVAFQLYWNRTSVWVFSCKFAVYFQSTFSQEHPWVAASGFCLFRQNSAIKRSMMNMWSTTKDRVKQQDLIRDIKYLV